MNRYLRCIVIMLLAAITIVPFVAYGSTAGDFAAEKPEQLVERLQAHYRQITSLSFSFVQTTSGQMSGRDKSGRGNAIFAKTEESPLMRWNYTTPERQVLISDGETVSMYFAKLNQMIIAPVEPAQTDILFSFFSGSGMLADDFLIFAAEKDEAEPKQSEAIRVVELLPKESKTQIRSIHLWISADLLIRRIELLDYFDTRTVINLFDISMNPLDAADPAAIEKLFTFTPPEGTEIIRH